MGTNMILAIMVLALILALAFTLMAILALGKQIRQLKLDLELDRANHQNWVDQFLLLSSRVRTLGEESAEWAGLVELHFAYLDNIEYKRRVRKELPRPLTPFSLRKQEARQQEGEANGGEG